jgi:hypothetical protein
MALPGWQERSSRKNVYLSDIFPSWFRRGPRVVKQAERGREDFKRFENGLSKFANYSSAERGSAACCAESLWLSGQGGILPPPPRRLED